MKSIPAPRNIELARVMIPTDLLELLRCPETRLSLSLLDEEQLATWQDYDVVSTRINEYASPTVNFNPTTLEFDGRKFAIIQVEQFDDVPILCAKEYKTGKEKGEPTLRRGACYVRARHKPETSEIPSEEEMRELLELAIDKGVRKFLTRARIAGLFGDTRTAPSDEALFEEQIEEME